MENQVPLANWQKARLLVDCIPFVFFALISIAAFTLFGYLFGVGTRAILMKAFIALVLLVLGFQALQRIRDLLSGQANVVVDVLERSWRSGGSANRSRMFFGKFQQLGRIRIMPKAHFGSYNGQRYRVTYSPISRIVWTLEPIN
jgi:hypothetical protein